MKVAEKPGGTRNFNRYKTKTTTKKYDDSIFLTEPSTEKEYRRELRNKLNQSVLIPLK